MNKKIVILHPAFWMQAMGGAEIQIKYLVDFLLKQSNIQVHFIFEDKNIEFEKPNIDNLILHPLSKINLSKRYGNRWWLYKRRINNLLTKIEPDGIYTRFFSSWSGFASENAKQNNIPHVWALASDNDLRILDKDLNLMKPLNIIENSFVQKAFRNATHIIVQNSWQEKKLQQKYNRKGVYLKQAAPIELRNMPPKEIDLLQIVWIANLKPLKRPDHFIKIASFFRGQKDMKFKMIGRLDNRYKEQIDKEEKQNPNFNYLGELSNKEVNELLLKTDILINTSDYEGFSNTFIQAWMRKNIVLSMNSNPDEILNKYNVGFLCPTVTEIAEKITMLSKNQSVLREMQDSSYKYANEEHNLDNNLNAIYKLLKLI